MDHYSPTHFFHNDSEHRRRNFNTYSRNEESYTDSLYQEEDEDYRVDENLLNSVTKAIRKPLKIKRDYTSTPNKIRLELIEAVHYYGEKISSAAKRLGIKYSSAKAICQVYKREGRSDKKIPVRFKLKEQVITQETQDESITVSSLVVTSRTEAKYTHKEDTDKPTNCFVSSKEIIKESQKKPESQGIQQNPQDELSSQYSPPINTKMTHEIKQPEKISQTTIKDSFVANTLPSYGQEPLNHAIRDPQMIQSSPAPLIMPSPVVQPIIVYVQQPQLAGGYNFTYSNNSLSLGQLQVTNLNNQHQTGVNTHYPVLYGNRFQSEGLNPPYNYITNQSFLPNHQAEFFPIHKQGLTIGSQISSPQIMLNPRIYVPHQKTGEVSQAIVNGQFYGGAYYIQESHQFPGPMNINSNQTYNYIKSNHGC